MIGSLVLVAAFTLTVFLPRVGGSVICAALICAGCTNLADGRSLTAALTFVNAILFGVIPFFIHHQFPKPHRGRSTTEQ